MHFFTVTMLKYGFVRVKNNGWKIILNIAMVRLLNTTMNL